MSENKPYKCVNCGEPAAALFKTYGPSVLKLTKCDKCKGVVDKYIEYDPVIVMIDLVLISKEAQRHVLYNTEFKSYWKLLIVLIMLETYGVWRSDSLFNIVIDTVCGTRNNNTINATIFGHAISLSVPESWRISSECVSWARDQRGDDTDLFIWEKDFYIKFISIFAGIAAFLLTVQTMMQLLKPLTSQSEALLLRAFSLGAASVLAALPALVWAEPEAAAETRALHYSLVFLYSAVLFTNIFTVLYECPLAVTVVVLTVSNTAKYSTCFYITPYLRNFVT